MSSAQVVESIIQAVNGGFSWGITLGIAVTAAFLAISLLAWLFTRV